MHLLFPSLGATCKSTPELPSPSLSEANITTLPEEDPTTVYTLEPPIGLLRPPVKLNSPDQMGLVQSIMDAERQRVQLARDAFESTVGQQLDPWFVGLQYLQLSEQCLEQQEDFLALYEAKQHAFFKLTRELEEYHAMKKRLRGRDRKSHIDLLKSIQVSFCRGRFPRFPLSIKASLHYLTKTYPQIPYRQSKQL